MCLNRAVRKKTNFGPILAKRLKTKPIMKKLIAFFTVLALSAGLTFGQTDTKGTDKGAKTETTKGDAKAKDTKSGDAKAGPTKKDGTPDKRFKENKDANKDKPAGPTKKDGTPDMRYKANKDAAKDKDKKAAPKK
jgi:hypothetical protein